MTEPSDHMRMTMMQEEDTSWFSSTGPTNINSDDHHENNWIEIKKRTLNPSISSSLCDIYSHWGAKGEHQV